ncbi:MAG: hypothetical protein JNG84_12075, partial [Archangium sp.]|nr:hypothetical protein [Archangium sp.]
MRILLSLAVIGCLMSACTPKLDTSDGGATGGGGGGGTGGGGGGALDGGMASCSPGAVDLGLPQGLCATIAADNLGIARHLTFSPSGDLYVAIQTSKDGATEGHITALRDANDDGVFEQQQ